MELKTLLAELVSSLSLLDFVASIDLQTQAFTLKGRVLLKERGFLEIYFNEQTQTTAVAWIEEERRIWGIDRDNLRGWHRHPQGNERQQRCFVDLFPSTSGGEPREAALVSKPEDSIPIRRSEGCEQRHMLQPGGLCRRLGTDRNSTRSWAIQQSKTFWCASGTAFSCSMTRTICWAKFRPGRRTMSVTLAAFMATIQKRLRLSLPKLLLCHAGQICIFHLRIVR